MQFHHDNYKASNAFLKTYFAECILHLRNDNDSTFFFQYLVAATINEWIHALSFKEFCRQPIEKGGMAVFM